MAWVLKLVSGGRIEPADEHLKEYWSLRNDNRSVQPWFIRAAKGEKFWRQPENIELTSNEEPDKEALRH